MGIGNASKFKVQLMLACAHARGTRVCVALLVSYSIDNRQLLRTMTSGHRLDVAAISSAVAGAVTQALRMQQQGESGSNKCSFLRMSH